MRDKLATEGLFDPRLKKPLPAYCRRIAVVTSPTGAAIRDFLEVLRRRWRGADVWIVPVRVPGEGAAAEIAAAIGEVNRVAEPPDCLVVTRGGGSRGPLGVQRGGRGSGDSRPRVPVVSAVDEIDVTLSDLVADVRVDADEPPSGSLRRRRSWRSAAKSRGGLRRRSVRVGAAARR